MNKTIQELIERKSVRVFTSKPISRKDKELILTASVNAPSPGNQEMYRIIDITDEEIKKELSVLCDNQPFIAKAKMVLAYCADFRKWYDAFKHAKCEPRKVGTGDIVMAIEDAMIASENAVTAA